MRLSRNTMPKKTSIAKFHCKRLRNGLIMQAEEEMQPFGAIALKRLKPWPKQLSRRQQACSHRNERVGACNCNRLQYGAIDCRA
jgi:hypothetical protein